VYSVKGGITSWLKAGNKTQRFETQAN